MVPRIRTRRQGSCHASTEHFQHCAEFLLLRYRGLGPLAVTVLAIPLARRAAATALEKRIREALAAPGRPGVRVIAKQFGVDPGTVQRISRPFAAASVAAG
jgi:hypothetical protein